MILVRVWVQEGEGTFADLLASNGKSPFSRGKSWQHSPNIADHDDLAVAPSADASSGSHQLVQRHLGHLVEAEAVHHAEKVWAQN